jgi:hypothetical protein
MLSIPEKVFLLSLYEKRNGSIQFSRSPLLSFGLIAGSLMDIVISNVGIVNSSRKMVITTYATENNFIPGDLLRQIQYETNPKRCTFWIEALGRKRKRVEAEFLESFIEKRILVFDGQVCHFHQDVASVPSIKYLTKEEIRRQIIGGETISIDNFCVIKLLDQIHLMDQIFTFDEIKPIHHRIDELKSPDQPEKISTQTTEWILGILESLTQVLSSLKE